VEFSLFDENKKPLEKKVIKSMTPQKAEGTEMEDISADFENIQAKYILIRVSAIKTCPDWHVGSGSNAWVFMDEIIVTYP